MASKAKAIQADERLIPTSASDPAHGAAGPVRNQAVGMGPAGVPTTSGWASVSARTLWTLNNPSNPAANDRQKARTGVISKSLSSGPVIGPWLPPGAGSSGGVGSPAPGGCPPCDVPMCRRDAAGGIMLFQLLQGRAGARGKSGEGAVDHVVDVKT